jgi:hypothetical protein
VPWPDSSVSPGVDHPPARLGDGDLDKDIGGVWEGVPGRAETDLKEASAGSPDVAPTPLCSSREECTEFGRSESGELRLMERRRA